MSVPAAQFVNITQTFGGLDLLGEGVDQHGYRVLGLDRVSERSKGGDAIEPRHLGGDCLKDQLRGLVAGAAHGRTDRPVYHVHCDPVGDRADRLADR